MGARQPRVARTPASSTGRGRRRGRAGGARRAAGFTLLELLVAMVVVLLALLLAGELLDESGRLLHHSVRRAHDPLPLLAGELLRNDLRAARAPAAAPGAWSAAPLRLELPGSGPVSWRRRGSELLRADLAGERPRLRAVERWRWRALPRGVIEVEVVYRASGAWLSHAGPGAARPDPGAEQRLRILVAAKGGRPGW